jgi:hypothetical protein
MNNNQPTCVHCQRSVDLVPLIPLQFQNGQYWICPQHLPILIHKPQMLEGKLPGAENLTPEGHDHH